MLHGLAVLALDPRRVLPPHQVVRTEQNAHSVQIDTGLDNNAKLLVAQNTQLRVVVAFVSEGPAKTLTYIVTTRK